MALTDAQKTAVTERLNTVIPDMPSGREALVSQIIDDAAAWAETYTNRTSVPNGMLIAVGDLAIIAYNRIGTEGESGRSEGGESYSFETAPARVYDALRMYRLVKAGGKTHETTETE